MGKDDSRAMLYLGIGALAAVGAGVLVWKYVLSDETKERVKARAKATAQSAQAKASDVAHKVGEKASEKAHDLADAARVKAAHVADAAGDSLKRRAAAALEKSNSKVDEIK